MKPLDGRVADINRRVTDTASSVSGVQEHVEALASVLGAYTATTTESNAYVGTELRSMEESVGTIRDVLETLTERLEVLTRRDYRERLQASAETPLAQLDGAVANLVNYAAGHRGFAAQGGLWFNPPVTVELSKGAARLVDVNERIVEVPWAFRTLSGLDPGARILEIGAAESTFALSMAALGYRVTALDLHPLPYTHQNLESFAVPFEDWEPPPERFDAAFLISTIEHFGLGAYGETAGTAGADRAAIERVGELLAEDGFLVLTTPYGTAQVNALERVYDEHALDALLKGWTVTERRTIVRVDRQTWVPLEGERSGEQGDMPGVAMVVALPPRHA